MAVEEVRGVVRRLRPRRDRRQEEAAELRRLLQARTGLPQEPVDRIVAALDQETASAKGWTFVMLSPADNARVVDWLVRYSERPKLAVRLWAHLFMHLRWDTGLITQTRDEIAQAMGVHPDHVSRVMTELTSIGAVVRHRERGGGVRGPGPAVYRMNAVIATHLTGKARDEAQAEAPPLVTPPPKKRDEAKARTPPLLAVIEGGSD